MNVIALVGNPNVGKTTLFNTLTHSKQYVGNWAGVTVDKKEGFLNDDNKIVDLPGIYAMDTYSNEEKVSKNFLEQEDVSLILNIVDASNLERNLYLTSELKQFNKPIILIVNMLDAAEEKGIFVDCKALEESLGIRVLPILACRNTGIKELIACVENKDFLDINCMKLENYTNEKETYANIEKLLKGCVTKKDLGKPSFTEKIDKIVLNKFLAFPIFFLIMFLIFKLTFSWVGQPLSDLLDKGLNNLLIPYLHNLLSGTKPFLSSLIIDGIVSGVGSILVFVPIIMTLFFGISILEDSGYMSRAALIMDKLMRKMGLSGKAFIPLIVGFGCSVPGIMSARTLESEKDRKLTALLVPLMSCNARLPVYALFTSVFFPKYPTLIVFILYLLGIALAFLIGILFKNTLFKKDEEPFIIEMPDYKLPEGKNLLNHTIDKGKGFIKKAGTIIFAISVVVWFLSNFNFTGMVNINDSFLCYIGKVINPIFIPLGFGKWQNSVAILTGVMAKEVVVSTMEIIYGANLKVLLPNFFTTASAISFLVFVLLYTPCVSVIATMKKEYGGKMAIFSVLYQLILAWVVSFLAYNLISFIL